MSNLNDLFCGYQREANGFLRLTVRGRNFVTASKVLIDGKPPTGYDLNGNPAVGETTFISSTELLVRVPPNPPLLVQKIAESGIVTSVNINTGNAARPEQIFQAVAANKGLLKVLDLKNANIPAGETVRVCGAKLFNKEGGETCLSMVNLGPNPITVSPTWFAAVAYCKDTVKNAAARLRCAEIILLAESLFPSTHRPLLLAELS